MQTATENKDTIIHCKVKGIPMPEISWDFNGQPVDVMSKFLLTIKRAMKTVTYKHLQSCILTI